VADDWIARLRSQRRYGAQDLRAIGQCDFDFLEGTAPIPEPEIH